MFWVVFVMVVCIFVEVLYCVNENIMNLLFLYVIRVIFILLLESFMFFIKFMKKFSWLLNLVMDMDVVLFKIKMRFILYDGDIEIMIKKIIYSKIFKDFYVIIC